MTPTIKVDAANVLARFSPLGIPTDVRNELRQVLPDLTRRLGALAQDNLIGGVDSWTHIEIKKEMVENAQGVTGRVRAVWTGSDEKKMVPQWIESGTKAHEIWARGARGGTGPKALYFFWKKMGTYFIGPMVHHPGTAPRWYMRNALAAMQEEIVESLSAAVRRGLRKGAA